MSSATLNSLGVGCPMWMHRDWIGRSLPADTPSGSELAAYARVCNAVEGNTTFYATPPPATVTRWRDATDPAFRFVMKLPKPITHERRLRDVHEPMSMFLSAMAPLQERLGPLLVQLPASFGPEDVDVLDRFLASASSAFAWAVEVRHRDFHAGGDHERALNDLLHRHDVNRVMFDSRPVFAGPRVTPEEVEAWERKPRNPVRAVATADQPMVRFIGQTAPEANPPFWRPWVPTVARWIEAGRRPIVFLHTPDNVAAPELCRQFHAEVVAAAGIEPLPAAPAVGRPVPLFPDH